MCLVELPSALQAMLACDNGLPGEHLAHELKAGFFQRREEVHLLVGDSHFVDHASDLWNKYCERCVYINTNFMEQDISVYVIQFTYCTRLFDSYG